MRGPLYTLMQTRQQFWIIFGNGSVKHYIAGCGECALQRAKPVRQILSDLPSFRVTRANKPFQICGTDFLGPIMYRQGRSDCKDRGCYSHVFALAAFVGKSLPDLT